MEEKGSSCANDHLVIMTFDISMSQTECGSSYVNFFSKYASWLRLQNTKGTNCAFWGLSVHIYPTKNNPYRGRLLKITLSQKQKLFSEFTFSTNAIPKRENLKSSTLNVFDL